MRKEKWLFIDVNKPPPQNCQYFLNIFTDLLDFYSMQYDNKVVLEGFNLKPNNSIMLKFLNDCDFTNLIKCSTCFKGDGSVLT